MTNESQKTEPDAIMKRVQAYGPYPITRISKDALRVLVIAADTLPLVHRREYVPLLKLLECYLCVNRQRLGCSKTGTLRIGRLYEEFVGAIYSPHFLLATVINRYVLARAWNALVFAIDALGLAEVRTYFKPSSTHVMSEIESLVEVFNVRALDADEVFFWRSSQIQRRDNALIWVPLRPIGVRYGRSFCEYIHTACHTHIFAQNGRIIEVNSFLEFLANLPPNYTLESFRGREVMEVIWKKFKRHFVEVNLGPSTYQSLVAGWRMFLGFALTHLNGVGPFGKAKWGLTRLPSMDGGVHGPNIVVKPDGTLVAQKLLIEVPLEVTDDAALQIIFKELGDRVRTISKWARISADAIWERQVFRVESASNGDAESLRITNVKCFTNTQIACMAAKLEKFGFVHTDAKASPLAQPLNDAAFQLGLPVTGALLPHMALLVIAHPELTPSFFDSCELYDKSGQVNGVVQTNNGLLLQGHKLRRGANLAQQVIHLTSETEELVNQIIALTTPLRNFLKARGDDNWRKLFLSCGPGFGYPKGIKATGLTSEKNRVKELEDDFVAMGLVTEAEVSGFVGRFSLTSLRASTAVLSYIENPDIAAMAKKLGHAKYSPALLARYMPAPLLAFFQQRWVRLFQCAIVATAMEKSDFRLRASGFDTMDKLHEFLKNHALKLRLRCAVASAKDSNFERPDSVAPNAVDAGSIAADEVVFGVSVENLTILLSLSMAINESQRPIAQTARYWATYGERLVAHIDNCDENRADLHAFLAQARALASPAIVRGMIHA